MSAVPGKNCTLLIDYDGNDEAELLDALRNLTSLFGRMRTRVARIGLEAVSRDALNVRS
jgi:hypothetical protein